MEGGSICPDVKKGPTEAPLLDRVQVLSSEEKPLPLSSILRYKVWYKSLKIFVSAPSMCLTF